VGKGEVAADDPGNIPNALRPPPDAQGIARVIATAGTRQEEVILHPQLMI
jgi:hypothetical protein